MALTRAHSSTLRQPFPSPPASSRVTCHPSPPLPCQDDPFRISAFTTSGSARRVYHRALFRASVTNSPLGQPRVLAQVLSYLPMREALLCARVCASWRDLFLRCDLVYWKHAARSGVIPPSYRGAFWLMMAYDATPELLDIQSQAVRQCVEAGERLTVVSLRTGFARLLLLLLHLLVSL